MGDTTDLGEFLFGSERSSLGSVREALTSVQGDRCFYCGAMQVLDVDHFIPWSLYQIDLGHNFVLAHKSLQLGENQTAGVGGASGSLG